VTILPSTQRVGRLMRGRTRTTGKTGNVAGVVEGDFTDATSPTGDEAQDAIELAAASLVDVIGDRTLAETGDDTHTPWPPELQDLASAAIAYQAAADIETSYFAEETLQDPSNRDYYQMRANQLRDALIRGIDEWRGGGETGEPSVDGAYTLQQPSLWGTPVSYGNRMVVTGDDPDRGFWSWFGERGGW
jgi:hypothetical protein